MAQYNQEVLVNTNALYTKPIIRENNPSPSERFLARLIDLYIVFMAVNLMLKGITIYFPILIKILNSPLIDLGLIFFIHVIYIFIEAIILTKKGATFGKWIFGLKIRDIEGNKPTFICALKRSFLVWVNGMGMGFLTFFTILDSFNHLVNEGTTTWDQKGNFFISQDKTGSLQRILMVIILLVIISSFFYLGKNK